jgi:hypothetical protein
MKIDLASPYPGNLKIEFAAVKPGVDKKEFAVVKFRICKTDFTVPELDILEVLNAIHHDSIFKKKITFTIGSTGKLNVPIPEKSVGKYHIPRSEF